MTMPDLIQPEQPRKEFKKIALQPGLGPTDFHQLGPLKTTLVANVSLTTKRLKRKWLRKQSKGFYVVGFDALVKRWDKCSNVVEDMSRNKYFSQVRISHVLRFVSICDLFTGSPSYINETDL
jgi:hypothetical protein